MGNELVNDVPLGPDAMIILVDCPIKLDAFLWRPTPSFTLIGAAKDNIVAWPKNRVVLHSTDHIEEEEDRATNPVTKDKCKLMDLSGNGKVVALGRVESTDPNAKVHFRPLGTNAVKVWIMTVKEPAVELWRQTSELQYMEDALSSVIAWPATHVVME